MSPRRTSADHQDVVARRLAMLSASLTPEAGREASPWPSPSWAEGHTRVRHLEEDSADGPQPVVQPVVQPAWPGEHPLAHHAVLPAGERPGRHAARAGLPWSGWLPPSLRGKAGLGASHVAVVAVLACLGLMVTCWWLVRTGSEPVVTMTTVSAEGDQGGPESAVGPWVSAPESESESVSQAEPGPGPESPSSVPAGEVTVHVAGKVRRPGIVVLPTGSRVADALEAAGGARPGVSLTALNLARPLVDGEQVLVGVSPPPGAPSTTPPSGAPETAALVNLNTADQLTLETLPGVGPVTAGAILAWREANGGFTAVEELIEVDGIGEKTLATLAPLVTV